jgi:CheY-like chemotaxis protein
MSNNLNARILVRAIELKGSADALAAHIGTTEERVLLWKQGRAHIPAEMLDKLLDVLLDADVASLTGAKTPLPKAQPPRVLVIDDDPSGAYSLARVLKQLGHEVATAGDGPAALLLARRFKPDVVFVDLRMPGMDGVEIARLLRAEGLGTHIIAATAYRAELERDRTTAAGFSAHVLKPVDQRALREILTALH